MTAGLEAQLKACVTRHHQDGILLDTNVLLLLLLANFQPLLVGGKRLEKYALEDGLLLTNFVRLFSRILTTPHILAETSNLASQALSGKLKTEFFSTLFPLFCNDSPEALHSCEVKEAGVDRPLFIRLGLTDASVVASLDATRLLLTDDLDLYLAAIGKGVPAINFTHMREAAGLL
jgi:hypothetical protein